MDVLSRDSRKDCEGHITRGVGKLGIEFDDDTLRVSEGSLYL